MTQNAFVRTYDLPASMAKFVILWTHNPEEDFREALELAGPYDYEEGLADLKAQLKAITSY